MRQEIAVTFQELIFALEKYWAKQGCVIQQPYDLEVGAGTFNPATFLRALGRSLGMSPMWNHHGDPPTAGMAKIRTGFSTITSTR